MANLARPYSDKYLAGQGDYDLFKNKNTDWTTGPFLKVFYVLLIVIVWGLLHVTEVVAPEDTWTVTNMVHGVITFVVLHWVKGCPDDSTQGEYNAYTLYEQIDVGVPWTRSKKFLMLAPTLLTWLACNAADYKKFHVIVNLGIFFICIIAKMPQMHGVRIFDFFSGSPHRFDGILDARVRDPGPGAVPQRYGL
jgi:hypothetical protein